MGQFDRINETVANAHQTLAIHPGDIHRVSAVAVAMLHNHLSGESWRAEAYAGSITLRSDHLPGRFVKVFVDYGNQVATKCGLSIHEDPIVVGIELTFESAYLREMLRNELSSKFSYYVDPREEGNSKWWLKPHKARKYDILFLTQGPCEYELDEIELSRMQEELEKSVQAGQEEAEEGVE